MPTAASVLAGKALSTTGGVSLGPLGTTMPTDATTALDAALKAAGYASDDGLTETQDRSTDKIKAWGGDTVKVVQTEHSLSYQVTLIETLNVNVLKAVHGDSKVVTTAATTTKGTLQTVQVTGDPLPRSAFVFEMKDGDARIRICVPDGQITAVDDISYTDGDPVGYPVTIECFPDENGVKAIKYIDDGVFSA